MALAMRTGELAMIDEPGVSALASVELAQPATSYETGLLEKLRAGDRLAIRTFRCRIPPDGLQPGSSPGRRHRRGSRHHAGDFSKGFPAIWAVFAKEAGLKTWVYRIAINQASNHQRWWRRRKKDWTVSLDQSVSSDDDSLKISDTLCDRRQTPEAAGNCTSARQAVNGRTGTIETRLQGGCSAARY